MFFRAFLAAILLLHLLHPGLAFAEELDSRAHRILTAAEEQPKLWAPTSDFSLKAGDKRTLGTVSFMVPLVQNQDTLFFADLRTVLSDQDTWEGNAGIGLRKITKYDFIAGGYAFMDARLSEHDNKFYQITAGAEVIGGKWDGRINIYHPLGEEEKLAFDNGVTASLSGTRLFLQDGRIFESALKGFDVEYGHALPYMDHIRAYMGHYRFIGNNVKNVEGYRARVAADIGEWVRIGAEKQFSDTARGDALFGEIRVRYPFGGWQEQSTKRRHMTQIQKRMMEPIIRDIDIVTAAQNQPEPVAAKTLNGEQSNIYFVDNTAAAGGDGSRKNPFNTLADAQAAAGDYDTIYVMFGDGTSTNMDAGIAINDIGQRLIGAGVALTIDTSKLKTPASIPDITSANNFVLMEADANPIITNLGGNGISTNADDVEIAGLTVDGAANDNIYIFNADNVTIRNVATDNATDEGLYAQYTAPGTYSLTIIDSSADTNGGEGFFIDSDNNSIVTADLTNNTATGNTNHGFYARSSNTSNLTTIFTDNTSTGNGNRGFFLQGRNNSTLNSVLTNNTADGNTSQGFGVLAANNGIMTITLSDNVADNNTSHGFIIRGSADGDITLTSTGDVSTGNGGTGFYINANDDSAISASFSDDTATGNTLNGFYFDDNSTLAITADMGGGALGSTGGNRVFSNTAEELRVDLDGDELKAENNWWGAAGGLPGIEVNLEDASTVDSTPFLTADPGP